MIYPFWCRIGFHVWRKVATINAQKDGLDYDVMRCKNCGTKQHWLVNDDRNFLPFHPFG